MKRSKSRTSTGTKKTTATRNGKKLFKRSRSRTSTKR